MTFASAELRASALAAIEQAAAQLGGACDGGPSKVLVLHGAGGGGIPYQPLDWWSEA